VVIGLAIDHFGLLHHVAVVDVSSAYTLAVQTETVYPYKRYTFFNHGQLGCSLTTDVVRERATRILSTTDTLTRCAR
jgi:hypothetical protein